MNIENSIESKSVSKLERMIFFIPSYQRGYRWEKQQISPQNPKNIADFIKEYGENELPEELRGWDNSEKYREIAKKYVTDTPDVLSNLTLLNSHDNRGIGNKYFFEKREKIKEYFQQGSFIPPCSMNVFMKFYTQNPKNLNFWDQNEDGGAYTDFIKETVDNFLKEEVNNE